MIGKAEIRLLSLRRRLPEWMIAFGLVGLCAAVFMPMGREIETPVSFFANPDRFYHDAKWTLLTPFLLAAIVGVLRLATVIFRRNSLVACGWLASAIGFLVFMTMDICLWGSICRDAGFSRGGMAMMLPVMAIVLVVTGAPTIACASLCAVPDRVRLAAAGGIIGIWSACVLGLILLEEGIRFDNSDGAVGGVYFAVASALLLAAGGVWETIRIWRRGEEPEAAT